MPRALRRSHSIPVSGLSAVSDSREGSQSAMAGRGGNEQGASRSSPDLRHCDKVSTDPLSGSVETGNGHTRTPTCRAEIDGSRPRIPVG